MGAAGGRQARDLMQPIPADTPLYRVRTSSAGKTYRNAADLDSPPREKAQPNRMSAAGIAMFYGAFEAATALAETVQDGDDVATVAEFRPTRKLWVAELERIPDEPSLFDVGRRHSRAPIRFLHRFADTLAQPVSRDGAEHIDYVPTQIVCEYLRHIFRDYDDEGRLDGLVFRSTKATGGRCVVLFIDADGCIEKGNIPPADRPALQLTNVDLRQI
jgi:hypothetical protein